MKDLFVQARIARFMFVSCFVVFYLMFGALPAPAQDTGAIAEFMSSGSVGILGVTENGSVHFNSGSGGGGAVLCQLIPVTKYEFPQLDEQPAERFAERYFRGYSGRAVLLYADTTWNGVEREGSEHYCERLVVYELDRAVYPAR